MLLYFHHLNTYQKEMILYATHHYSSYQCHEFRYVQICAINNLLECLTFKHTKWTRANWTFFKCSMTFTESLEKKPTSLLVLPELQQASWAMSVITCKWFSNREQTSTSNCTLFIRMHICQERSTSDFIVNQKQWDTSHVNNMASAQVSKLPFLVQVGLNSTTSAWVCNPILGI